jgi:hypothetical protein
MDSLMTMRKAWNKCMTLDGRVMKERERERGEQIIAFRPSKNGRMEEEEITEAGKLLLSTVIWNASKSRQK